MIVILSDLLLSGPAKAQYAQQLTKIRNDSEKNLLALLLYNIRAAVRKESKKNGQDDTQLLRGFSWFRAERMICALRASLWVGSSGLP